MLLKFCHTKVLQLWENNLSGVEPYLLARAILQLEEVSSMEIFRIRIMMSSGELTIQWTDPSAWSSHLLYNRKQREQFVTIAHNCHHLHNSESLSSSCITPHDCHHSSTIAKLLQASCLEDCG